MNNLLQFYADKYGTDKGYLSGIFGEGHEYTDFYDKLMCSKMSEEGKLLEIGIGNGSSARMWLEYFSRFKIVMVDNSKNSVDSLSIIKSERLVTLLIDQTSQFLWDSFGCEFDFVIDDGSHRSHDQILSFVRGFKTVKPGGLWIIEDTHCDFTESFNPVSGELYKWAFNLVMIQQLILSGSGSFYKARAMNKITCDDPSYWIYSISFYKSVIIFEKARER